MKLRSEQQEFNVQYRLLYSSFTDVCLVQILIKQAISTLCDINSFKTNS